MALVSAKRVKRVSAVVFAVCALLSSSLAQPARATTSSYIVVLHDGISGAAHAKRAGLKPTQVYTAALDGYAAPMTDAQARNLSRDRDVESIEPDETFKVDEPAPTRAASIASTQSIPTGVKRVGGDVSPTAKIDGVDERVDADVAVLDSGIMSDHPDLNVAGGEYCIGRTHEDHFFHGTWIAGGVGAIDNDVGVVGVAPGVRLWAVKVINAHNFATTSSVICGVDWVTKHADKIDVALFGIGKFSENGIGDCHRHRHQSDALRRAVCRSVAAGVTYVAGAGNEGTDQKWFIPSQYPEVITVSVLADSDGLPGGTGPDFGTCEPGQADDHLWLYSNFGESVDIAAPGVCVESTDIYDPGYFTFTSNSYAAGLVAGAAALYKSQHPSATPADVKAAIIAARDTAHIPDDPDGIDEGLLNVSTF